MIQPLLTSLFLCLATTLPGEGDRSDEELYLEFARHLEATLRQGDPSFFAERFDHELLIERVVGKEPVEVDFLRGFQEGIAGFHEAMGAEIVRASAGLGASYAFLRMLPGEPPRALFRLVSESGLNYHELELELDPDRRVWIVDILIHVSGQPLSATLRQNFLAVSANFDTGREPSEEDTAYLEALPSISEFMQSYRTEPQRALGIYGTLPDSVKYTVTLLICRLQAALQVGDEEYQGALEDFVEHHPNSSALDLMMVDVHLFRGEHEKSLARIDLVDARVQGDPYLDILRAGVHGAAGRTEEAKKGLRRAMERDPVLAEAARWQLLDIAILGQDHEATLEYLILLEREHGVEWTDLATVAPFATFVASPEHELWLKRSRPGDGSAED